MSGQECKQQEFNKAVGAIRFVCGFTVSVNHEKNGGDTALLHESFHKNVSPHLLIPKNVNWDEVAAKWAAEILNEE